MSRNILIALALIGGPTACKLSASYIYNPSDFATQVVGYVPGTGVGTDFISGDPFNRPENALGRPPVDTTGEGFSIAVNEAVPVVPIYGAFRASELVTVGQGGSLTLKFDHPVTNDPRNPFGVDFIVFGNATVLSSDFWDNRDPSRISAGGGLFAEGGVVSVSKDGQTWVTFSNGPRADDFAPTMGRLFDPAHPSAAVGPFNQWWGEGADPTLPLDPSLDASSLSGKTVAELAQLYGGSAGGTGFDIGALGLDSIQFVRIENPDGSGVSPEIDAVADVAAAPEPGAMAALAALALLMGRRSLGHRTEA